METLRGWFEKMRVQYVATYEELVKREVVDYEQLAERSDKRRQIWDRDSNASDPMLTKRRGRVTQVNLNDRNNMFIPTWEALYKEKHGKLARVGYYQHVECDESTVFTRARAAKKAADEAGTFVPN